MKYSLDLDVGLDDLSTLFSALGWAYAYDGVYGIPSAEDLLNHIHNLLQTIPDHADFIRSGRITLIRNQDDEYRNSFDIMLDIGYLTPNNGDEPDMEVLG